MYISLDNFQLKFYTDHKIAMEAGNKTLGTFHLLQATVCTYTKEKKIKHTFVVGVTHTTHIHTYTHTHTHTHQQ